MRARSGWAKRVCWAQPKQACGCICSTSAAGRLRPEVIPVQSVAGQILAQPIGIVFGFHLLARNLKQAPAGLGEAPAFPAHRQHPLQHREPHPLAIVLVQSPVNLHHQPPRRTHRNGRVQHTLDRAHLLQVRTSFGLTRQTPRPRRQFAPRLLPLPARRAIESDLAPRRQPRRRSCASVHLPDKNP